MQRTPAKPSAEEQRLLRMIRDRRTSRRDLLAALRTLRPGQPFVLQREWTEAARSDRTADLQRLAAFQMLFERVARYPSPWRSFVEQFLLPLGIAEDTLTDMTMASYVPVPRGSDTSIRMASLPVRTVQGGSGLYIAVDRRTDTVEAAAVHPGAEEAR